MWSVGVGRAVTDLTNKVPSIEVGFATDTAEGNFR